MSEISPKNQSTANNPYSAPTSSPSFFNKSYVTLAACSVLVGATLLAGVWLYARSVDTPTDDEKELIFMERTQMGPIVEPDVSATTTSVEIPNHQ